MTKPPKGRTRLSVTFWDIDFIDLVFYARAKGYAGHNDRALVANMLHEIALTEMRRNALTDGQIKKYLLHNPDYAGRFLAAARLLEISPPPNTAGGTAFVSPEQVVREIR